MPNPCTAKTYPHRLRHYENDAGRALLRKLAALRGTSETALLRQLTREEAARQERRSARTDASPPDQEEAER